MQFDFLGQGGGFVRKVREGEMQGKNLEGDTIFVASL